MIKTPKDLIKLMTTHGVRNAAADTAPADQHTSYARVLGNGVSPFNDARQTRIFASRLRSALKRMSSSGRVNTRGNEIFVLVPLPGEDGRYGSSSLPDGSFDIQAHVSDGGGPTDIRNARAMESLSNALVESLLNETPTLPTTPHKLGRNVVAVEPGEGEIIAVDADEQTLNQLRQEGFEVDEYDVTLNVLPKSQARYERLVDAKRTFHLLTPSGLVVKTADFM